MRRRTFLQAAGSAAIVWPMPASAARDATLPLVAVLLPAPEESSKPRLAALREGLKDEGLLEGSHYSIEARFASGDFARLPEFAKELDELKPRCLSPLPMLSSSYTSCCRTRRSCLPP